MDYFEDMSSKWGFSDGEAVPPDAEQRREVYVTAINNLAERLGSAYRVVAYDRPGMHNYCLIVNEPDGQDDALVDAINIANELNLDACVTTVTTIHSAALHGMLNRPLDELKEAISWSTA